MFKKYFPLFLILLLATFLRFWQLESVPSGVHTDEADTGYSAYSLLKTGLDPRGIFSPLALSDNNAGGTHPPVYTYLLIPLVNYFGLNIFVERLPSAVFGLFTVLIVFLISNKLFKSVNISNVTTFLFAVNPWAIHISRQGLLEAGSLFFILLGLVLFLYSDRNKYLLVLSAFFFGISLYAYDAPKIFLPPFLLVLAYFYKSTLFSAKKYLAIFLIIFSTFYLSMLQLTFLKGGIKDYTRSSVFVSPTTVVNTERFRTNAPLWLSSIFHNKLTVSIKNFETSYVSIFSLNWFFVNGGSNLQRSVGNHGEFYLFELPFFFVGAFLIFKKNLKLGLFLLAWMLIGALPGGLTSGNYIYRSVQILPVPIIFSGFGIVSVWRFMNRLNFFWKIVTKLFFVFLMAVYISSYLVTYFFDYPVYASEYWSKQQDDAIKFAIKNKNVYKNIFIDGAEPWAIGYAFFDKTNPFMYQKAYKNRENYRNIKVIKLENVYIGMFDLEAVKKPSDFFPKNSLIITTASKFTNVSPLEVFYGPSRIRAIFKVVEVK